MTADRAARPVSLLPHELRVARLERRFAPIVDVLHWSVSAVAVADALDDVLRSPAALGRRTDTPVAEVEGALAMLAAVGVAVEVERGFWTLSPAFRGGAR